MSARFAVVNGGFGIVVDYFAAADGGIDYPVVAAVHAVFDLAFEIGDRPFQHNLPAFTLPHLNKEEDLGSLTQYG